PETVSKAAICWLEPDKRGTYPIHEVVFSPDDLRFVETLIQQVWQGIQQRDFTRGCGQHDCAWCRMLRDHTLTDTAGRDAESGLDEAP
ncbi:MAG TPA: hypothetical protein PKD78_17165, partial [Saprospiraceae bacterium]|nr:hypothetical protein [Saprospiraceae bacterium]